MKYRITRSVQTYSYRITTGMQYTCVHCIHLCTLYTMYTYRYSHSYRFHYADYAGINRRVNNA